MKPARTLLLKRELLTDLTDRELSEIAGGDATLLGLCDGGITVLVHGCPSDPRICHYYTQMC